MKNLFSNIFLSGKLTRFSSSPLSNKSIKCTTFFNDFIPNYYYFEEEFQFAWPSSASSREKNGKLNCKKWRKRTVYCKINENGSSSNRGGFSLWSERAGNMCTMCREKISSAKCNHVLRFAYHQRRSRISLTEFRLPKKCITITSRGVTGGSHGPLGQLKLLVIPTLCNLKNTYWHTAEHIHVVVAVVEGQGGILP